LTGVIRSFKSKLSYQKYAFASNEKWGPVAENHSLSFSSFAPYFSMVANYYHREGPSMSFEGKIKIKSTKIMGA